MLLKTATKFETVSKNDTGTKVFHNLFVCQTYIYLVELTVLRNAHPVVYSPLTCSSANLFLDDCKAF